MEIKEIAKALSEIEVKALQALNANAKLSENDIAEKASMNIDSVRRALAWLKEKGLANVYEKEVSIYELTEKGKGVVERGLPEERLIFALKKLGGKAKITDILKEGSLSNEELNIALGKARRYNLAAFNENKELELTGLEELIFKRELAEQKLVERIKKHGLENIEDCKAVNEFLKRGLIERRSRIIMQAEINERGKQALKIALQAGKRVYNLAVEVPPIYIGKKQPYARFLDEIRRKLIVMGFKEMESPLIVQEFYNFDVLFQPQNHPAREWASTFRLKKPKYGSLPAKRIVNAVKAAHENGAGTGSRGWRYKWSIKQAKRLMPAAHGTAHSARQLIKGIEIPGKYFSLARCYRPDKPDKTHLMEFNQLEGIIAAELNFKHLLGVLKQFAEEIAGAEKVRFYPDYYPFTEPSVQLSAKHPELGWIEFGGAGLFRPEMLEPLGIECNVLAWGLGIDRLAMFKLGIEDMRELFSSDLEWLRKEPLAVL
ncbi:MAG: phenylalanine--tRNA ligase subunit alpha [Candidatus Diapherotrites archaeon]|nr:phenylalanine--tRNA ligase subunit alpha [Candidatus Diapherotrites archaeon]